jgi:hypothetical protein
MAIDDQINNVMIIRNPNIKTTVALLTIDKLRLLNRVSTIEKPPIKLMKIAIPKNNVVLEDIINERLSLWVKENIFCISSIADLKSFEKKTQPIVTIKKVYNNEIIFGIFSKILLKNNRSMIRNNP